MVGGIHGRDEAVDGVTVTVELGELLGEFADALEELLGSFGRDACVTEGRADLASEVAGFSCGFGEETAPFRAVGEWSAAHDDRASDPSVEPFLDGTHLARSDDLEQAHVDELVDVIRDRRLRTSECVGQLGDGGCALEHQRQDLIPDGFGDRLELRRGVGLHGGVEFVVRSHAAIISEYSRMINNNRSLPVRGSTDAITLHAMVKKLPADDRRAQYMASDVPLDQGELVAHMAGHHRWVLSTTRADGRPQMSLVTGGLVSDGRLAISTYPERAKAKNARRNSAASVLVLGDEFNDAWLQIDGTAEVVDLPDASAAFIDYYRSISGEHPDWDEYVQAMDDQGKCMLMITPTRWSPLSKGGFPPSLFEGTA